MAVKMSSDMPLPTPRSVMSSPIHMMRPVPAVSVMMSRRTVMSESFGMIGTGQSPSSAPERASETRVVALRRPRAIVRYRVYWVSCDWPCAPSSCSSWKRGMTTRRSCVMMLAVMYGMMPSAKIETWSRAPPLKRFTNWYRPPSVFPSARHCWTLP